MSFPRSPSSLLPLLLLSAAAQAQPYVKVTYLDGEVVDWDTLHGQLLMRSVGGGAARGDISVGREVPLPTTIARGDDGSVTIALDGNADGVADLVMGGGSDGQRLRWYVAGTVFGDALWSCLVRRRPITRRRLRRLSRFAARGGRGPAPCGALEASGRALEGAGGGFDMGRTVGLPGPSMLGAPRCDVMPRPGTAGDGPEPAVEPVTPPPADPDPPADADPPAPDVSPEAVALAAEAAARQEPVDAGASVDRALTRSVPKRPSFGARVRRLMRRLPDIGGRVSRTGVYVKYTGRFRPAVGQPRGFEDPRCAGDRAQGAQGTLFTNPRFCAGLDLLECLNRQEDPVAGATGGRCHREPGPTGAPLLVCGGPAPGRRPHLSPNTPTAPRYGATDAPCRVGRLGCGRGRGRTTAVELISTTPLGPLLGVLCAADCPFTPQY